MLLKERLVTLLFITLAVFFTAPFCFGQTTHDTAKQNNSIPPPIGKKQVFTTTNDTLPVTKKDTVALKPGPYQPNPKKSGLYSALLPGTGQLNNHQYWKIPVIYAGLGIGAYFIIDNLNNYQSYRKAYIGRINNNNPTDQYVNIYSESQLQQLQNDYNKYLDLSVLFTCIGYAMQVMDAVTSAHLKNFDISRDISMKMRPVIVPGGVGMGIVMNFK